MEVALSRYIVVSHPIEHSVRGFKCWIERALVEQEFQLVLERLKLSTTLLLKESRHIKSGCLGCATFGCCYGRGKTAQADGMLGSGSNSCWQCLYAAV